MAKKKPAPKKRSPAKQPRKKAPAKKSSKSDIKPGIKSHKSDKKSDKSDNADTVPFDDAVEPAVYDESIDDDAYDRHKSRVNNRGRAQAADARDVGRIPRPKNWKRRQACERDLRRYLLTYYAASFPKPFSDDHERILKDIERNTLEGGLKAIAMPRGSGKTTILIRAGIWALSYGHCHFLALIEADGAAAEESLDVVKVELETNDLLSQDFPEIAVPIRALEGITQRANAQTCLGDRTLIKWTKRELVFPTVPGSKASGATFRCSGILGRIRGMQCVTPDGKTQRPDFLLVNDPQTDLSARSEIECAKRERVLSGACLGLAGPGERISGFAAVTVIREGDVADRLLNNKLNPKWHGSRCKMVYEWPTDSKLWEKYLEIRAEEIDAGDDTHPMATAFYAKNRKAMDAGSKVGWPARYFDHEISAIQHAHGLRADNPDTYDAEYDNTPKPTVTASTSIKVLTSDEYCLRTLQTHKRGELPDWTEYLTVGIDVHESTLWWSLLATSQDFAGLVVDYGIWPDQGVDYTTLDQCDRTYARATKIPRQAEALIAALNTLTHELAARRFTRDDGTIIPITQGLVDSGHRTESVYRFCSQATLPIPIMPCKGIGVGARSRPWETLKQQRGERFGFGYRIPPTKRVRGARHVLVDTNRWKTFVAESFSVEEGGTGAWHLFRASPARLRMLADNLAAEFPTETEGHGRKLYEWTRRPNRDNHFLDATVYAGAAAAMSGATANAETVTKIRRRIRRASEANAGAAKPRRSLAEMREAARGKNR